MKQSSSYLHAGACFLLASLLTGCGEVESIGDGHFSNERFQLSQYSLDFTATDLKKTIDITAYCTWTIEKPSGVDWLAVSPTKGDGPTKVTIESTDATNTSARTADLTITTATGLKNIIHVHQSPGKSSLTVSGSIDDFTPLGGDCTFSVTSNHAWTGTITAGNFGLFPNQEKAWKLEGTFEEGVTTNVSIHCSPNTTFSARTLTVTFTTDDNELTETRTITQSPGTLPTFTTDLTIGDITRNSAEATFKVQYDTFPITECGIYLRTDPTQEPEKTFKADLQTISSEGTVTIAITGLTSGKTYYAQAYARNDVGTVTWPTSAADAVEFTALGIPGRDDNLPLAAKKR